MSTRYCYELRTKRPHCICVLTTEIERICGLLGASHTAIAWTHIHTDTLMDPDLLESEETAVIRHDKRAIKRNYLRSVVAEYGRDKATLKRLGFIPC